MLLAFICGIFIGVSIGIIGLSIHILARGNDYPGLEDVTSFRYEDALENETLKS